MSFCAKPALPTRARALAAFNHSPLTSVAEMHAGTIGVLQRQATAERQGLAGNPQVLQIREALDEEPCAAIVDEVLVQLQVGEVYKVRRFDEMAHAIEMKLVPIQVQP